jgi:hypothetical protein
MFTLSLKTTAALYFVVPHVSHDPHHILLFIRLWALPYACSNSLGPSALLWTYGLGGLSGGLTRPCPSAASIAALR